MVFPSGLYEYFNTNMKSCGSANAYVCAGMSSERKRELYAYFFSI